MSISRKILMVEDDPILGRGLSTAFKTEGYDVTWAKSVEEALEKFSPGIFDLVTLDIGLPDGMGTNVCKVIRAADKSIPIIFITAKTDEETVLRGLEIGGNDFVKKPFSQKELLARVKVLLKATTWQADKTIGGLTIQEERREISYNDKPLELNRRQFDILYYFLHHPDQIITREQLLNHLGQEGAVYDRTIDSHLSQLRKVMKNSAIESVQIVPVYGVGYRLEIK